MIVTDHLRDLAVAFLLHRGPFHPALADRAKAFLSAGRHREARGQMLQVARRVEVAVSLGAPERCLPPPPIGASYHKPARGRRLVRCFDILHDKPEYLRRRRLTCLARRALGDLFTGPYPTA